VTKRILVVEDQQDLRAILRDLLTASGYDIIEAVDGCEGVTDLDRAALGLTLARVVATRSPNFILEGVRATA
jgi:DNA-binding response OmpR family regulator